LDSCGSGRDILYERKEGKEEDVDYMI